MAKLRLLRSHSPNMGRAFHGRGCWKEASPVSIAMADEYRIPNTFLTEWEFVIQSYRHYYLEGKWRFANGEKTGDLNGFLQTSYQINEYVRDYNARKPKMPLKEMKI